ncbi:MAG: isocitrate lyase/phosphoenolpyruvate mutase family protein [Pseudomonadales bacterium]
MHRAAAYTDAGANGIFVPGLVDEPLIEEFCRNTVLPNIMMMDGVPTLQRLAELGVSRVSYGPAPFFSLMTLLEERASAIYAS